MNNPTNTPTLPTVKRMATPMAHDTTAYRLAYYQNRVTYWCNAMVTATDDVDAKIASRGLDNVIDAVQHYANKLAKELQ